MGSLASAESPIGRGKSGPRLVPLSTHSPIWSRFFTVSALVLVATLSEDGTPDVAPKSMAMPLGWGNYYCFVCSPRHETYANAAVRKAFTVNFPLPDQIVQTSMAATPHEPDLSKPALAALETFPAREVDGVLVEGCYLHLECRLERVIDGFGPNSLIIGEIVAASVDERALRGHDRDDSELIHDLPLLAYLDPGRFAAIGESYSFPFPADL